MHHLYLHRSSFSRSERPQMRARSARPLYSAVTILALVLTACARAEPPEAHVLVQEYLESQGADKVAVWPVIAGEVEHGAEPSLSSIVLLEDSFAYRADIGVPVGGPVLESVPVCVGIDPESAKGVCGIASPLPPQVHESRHGDLFVYIFGPDSGITFSPDIAQSPLTAETDVYTMPLGGETTLVSSS